MVKYFLFFSFLVVATFLYFFQISSEDLEQKLLKIASYNVENLFDETSQGSEYDNYSKSHNWVNHIVEKKLNNTAEVICDLNADILGLQEIENRYILKRLTKRLKRVGCEYKYSAITHKKGSSVQVALISRYPISKTREIKVSDKDRNILEALIDINGNPLTIFVNHWKSKAYNGYESRRIQYAEALKKYLDPLKSYIILGDFNTDYDAHLALENKINDTNGKIGLHDIIGIAKDDYLINESDISKNPKGLHYSLWSEIELKYRFNNNFYGKKGSLDHIILPPNMFDGDGIDYINNSFRVFRRKYLLTSKGGINRWKYLKGKHIGEGYSDHLPIYAYFSLKPYIIGDDKFITQPKREIKNIEYLYGVNAIKNDLILKDSIVIWKRRRNAVIKQSPKGRGIFLYGCGGNLEKGKKYNILVKSIKTYNGLKEITHAYILKRKENVDISPYLLTSNSYRESEILSNIEGVYKEGALYINDREISIRFKNRKNYRPKDGDKIKINYALIGYYKKLELVIYSKKNFKIME